MSSARIPAFLVCSGLAACGTTELPLSVPVDQPAWQVDHSAPPPIILLSAPDSVDEGGDAEVTVALPVPPAPADGVGVHLVVGEGGLGSGICPNLLFGKCLDILGPYTIHGPFSSLGGEVVESLAIPGADGDAVAVQAVVLRPNNAFLSETAEVAVVAPTTGDTHAPLNVCESTEGGVGLGTNSGSGQAQELMIYAVDVARDVVILRNTSSSVYSLTGGDICQPFSYWGFNSSTVTSVPPDGTLVLHLSGSGTDTDGHIWAGTGALAASDEVMIYRNAAGHATAGIESYLRWGPNAPGGRESQAVGVGLWTTGAATVGAGHEALIATGDVTTPGGFTSIPSICECYPDLVECAP